MLQAAGMAQSVQHTGEDQIISLIRWIDMTFWTNIYGPQRHPRYFDDVSTLPLTDFYSNISVTIG